ncbi:hypothetical protein MLD38_031979 [Melastoma candidum]|uniref:Uncharacterized protein n=1 Tax=Melastoma candidum TaxID=119954 RepID=A0ACB9MR89_9MYRT|nr:hypothetical protein MLD38_031979 [Melastoma candidum]
MAGKPISCSFIILLFLVGLASPSSGNEDFRVLLVKFMQTLSPYDPLVSDKGWGWNTTSDPCDNGWKGVSCDVGPRMVRKVVLDKLNFTGTLDAGSLCSGVGSSLFVLSLTGNQLTGGIPQEIAGCDNLNHLYLSGNHFSGELPGSLSLIKGLKRFDVSNNNFTGELPPGLAEISGMKSFLAQNNRISGNLPKFDLTHLEEFNVSNNELSGPIPQMGGHFRANSFLDNPNLCGKPLDKECPPTTSSNSTSKDWSIDRYLIYAGYAFIGLVIITIIILKLVSNMRRRKPKVGDENQNVAVGEDGSNKADDLKTSEYRSQYSMESGTSSALVILDDDLAKDLKFEDLLRAPAELLGRGSHGSLYKVILNHRAALAVKRIKGSGIPNDEFTRRMHSLNKVRHRRVLPAIAFYSSNQEKLLVYEHQPNGSLFKLLHGSENGKNFTWGSRLVAATSMADALAYMHEGLREDGIAHGNLKSTDILFDGDKEAFISEYGLIRPEKERRIEPYGPKSLKKKSGSAPKGRLSPTLPRDDFKEDVYDFGVILLEMLTGKSATHNGLDLARWVNSMVREEWTGEVFDRALLDKGTSEERMVNLLQVAIKCTSASAGDRPDMSQVSKMISAISEEEEKSSINSPFSFTGDSVSM